jgi:hypothetical protein
MSIKALFETWLILKMNMAFHHFREIIMLQVAVLLWLLFAITLSGIFVTVVLLVPQLDARAMQYIPLAALFGSGLAILPSWIMAETLVQKVK